MGSRGRPEGLPPERRAAWTVEEPAELRQGRRILSAATARTKRKYRSASDGSRRSGSSVSEDADHEVEVRGEALAERPPSLRRELAVRLDKGIERPRPEVRRQPVRRRIGRGDRQEPGGQVEVTVAGVRSGQAVGEERLADDLPDEGSHVAAPGVPLLGRVEGRSHVEPGEQLFDVLLGRVADEDDREMRLAQRLLPARVELREA